MDPGELQKVKRYSEVLPKVIEYAVDAAEEETLTFDGLDLATLSEDFFVKRLYVNWPNQKFEDDLYQRLRTSTQVTCVAAYRGCGKTSAIRHAISRLREDHPTTIYPVLLDIKDIYDIGTFAPLPDRPTEESRSKAYEIFKTEIRKAVQQRLFKPSELGRLLAWALAGPPDDTERFSPAVVSDLLDISNRAIITAKISHKPRRERMLVLEHILQNDARFLEYEAIVVPHLRTAHVVRAAMTLHDWKRIVLIYDNIDRIAIPYQVKFMEAVNDTHNALKGTCGSIVAVRRETLRYPQPRANEKGDPIDIIAPLEAQFKDILYADTKAGHVKAIFQKRHDLTVELCNGNETPAPEELAKAIALHSCVVDEFVRDSIYALANGSVRALAKIYTNFISYVREMETSGAAGAYDVRADEGHLQTLFFLCLRDRAREFGLVFYEILRLDDEPPSDADVPDLASPHHLVMTALLNLTRELKEISGGERVVTFRELVARLKVLGYSFETIRDTVADLHAPPGDPPRIVEFVDDAVDIGDLQPTTSAHIRLTSAGYVLVSSLLHKVGYVWGQAHAHAPRPHARRERGRTYYELEPHERMAIFYDYVRNLAERHVRLLCVLRRRLYPKYGWRWLKTYREFFGVSRELQVERLCKSAAAFYNPTISVDQQNPFSELLETYRGYIRPVHKGVPFERFLLQDLRRPMDVVMREGKGKVPGRT